MLHSSKQQLEIWKEQINNFLREKLKLELHPEKSRIIQLSRGVDFIGFRNFHYFKLLRKRNIKNMERKINLFEEGKIWFKELIKSFEGWQAYSKCANTHKLHKRLKERVIDIV